jgi:hypothetical protein
MADPAKAIEQNLLPVQAYFDVYGNFQTFIGQGKPFYASINPVQSGLTITNSTINSTTIGALVPSTGVFTDVKTTTGQISTSPVAAADIANKAYVDAIAQGLNPKQACKVATTAPLANLSGLLTLDTSYTLQAGDRVLVKNQTTQSENGIYVASASAWTRAADMNIWAEVPGAYTVVLFGTTQSNTAWVSTSADTGTIDVTPITFVQFSGVSTYTAGTGLTLALNQFSITNTTVVAGTYGTDARNMTLVVNAQGQITSVYDQPIAIAASQITSGILGGAYGGTGVNNGSNTLTLSGSYTLNQSVASGASPSFLGTNFTSIPNSALTNSSITVNGSTIALGGSATITAVNPFALTLGTGLSGTSYDGSSAVTAAIANTTVVAASYTYANFTVNAQGQLTAASSNATTGTGSIVLANSPTISGAWGSPDSINFDITPTIPTAQGSLYWDNADSIQTLSLVMEGGNAIQQIGEETYFRIKCSAAITEGQVVMFTGTVGSSGALTGAPATGLTASTASYIMGVATESGALNDWIYVTAFGLVRGINTTGGAEAWVDGQILYYDPTVTGGLTKTLPTAPNAKVQVCAVVHADNNGSLFIRPSFGGILGQYEGDVGFSSTAAYDLVQRNSANTAWVNVAPGSISIGTATNLAGGLAGAVPYQSGVGATAFTTVGSAGQVLTSQGAGTPTWTTPTAYATVTDDTTTNGTRYPLFANQTTGNLTTEYTSSTKLQYNPSTGIFTATGFSGSGANLTSLPAGQLSGTIPSGVLGNSTLYIGTTAVVLNAASGSITSLAVNISGSAASASTATTATNATNVAVTDDTSTNATFYPAIVSNSTGNLPIKTSSTKLQFNPSTGALTATGGMGGGAF